MADRLFYIQDVLNGAVLPVLMHDVLGDGTQYSFVTSSPAGGGDGAITGPIGRRVDAQAVSAALSTEDVALLTALLTTTAFQARIPAPGQLVKATSIPVVPASDWGAFDSTDRLRASLYGKVSAAGDTAVLLTTAGRQILAGASTGSADGVNLSATLLADSADNSRALGVVTYQHGGASLDRVRIATRYVDINAVAIGTIATILTPTSGKKFRILGGTISVSAAASVLFEDNAAAAFIFRTPKLLADTPYTFTTIGNGTLSAAANNLLKATGSAAANLSGTLWYCEE